MLAKIAAYGRDRREAIERMRQALSAVTIDGVATNIALHRRIMAHGDFQAGEAATDFLAKLMQRPGATP